MESTKLIATKVMFKKRPQIRHSERNLIMVLLFLDPIQYNKFRYKELDYQLLHVDVFYLHSQKEVLALMCPRHYF